MNVELLLPPQREHAVSLLNSLYINGVACDQSETGTGKTYVAAWLAKNLNRHIISYYISFKPVCFSSHSNGY